jgi:hypothetical protein
MEGLEAGLVEQVEGLEAGLVEEVEGLAARAGLDAGLVGEVELTSRIDGLVSASKRGRDISGLFDGLFVSNGCRALLFLALSRQGIQVEKTLVPGFAEGVLRKQESTRFWAQAEQYLDSIR